MPTPQVEYQQYDRFARLYGNGRRFLSYALGLARNHDDAEDLLQECKIKAMTCVDGLRDDRAFESWFYTLMKHTFIDFGRRNQIGQRALSIAPELVVSTDAIGSSSDEDPVAIVVRDSVRGDVWQAIRMLSFQHAEVVVLHYIDGYSVPEIVDITGEADGTVRSRISRALSRLRWLLASIVADEHTH